MVKCQVCNYDNEDGAEYCEECGVKIGAAPTPSPVVAAAATPAADPEPVKDAAPVVESQPKAGGVTCGACQHVSPDGTRFCPKCGSKMDAVGAPAAAAAPPDKCPTCGASVDAGATFCMSCGARVSGGEVPKKPKGEVLRLRMVAGKEKDKLFEIEKNEIRLGRLAENDIPLDADGYVSGKHTRVYKQGGEFFVEDLGSTNGTFLKVRKATKIAPGDEIKVGQSIFRLE